ncbi:MAG: hypothetical protein GX996_01535 [Firmicutes bacterium]|nr:hypothetical protein [Bacillota bacterium]
MRIYTERELRILTIVVKVLLCILGVILLLAAIINPLWLIAAIGAFVFAYKYKAKNKEPKTPEYKCSNGEVREYVESLTGKKPADNKDGIGLNVKITARIEGAPEQTFTTRVAGVSYNNPDGTSRQAIIAKCSPGQPVKLIRERDNPYDKTNTAIAVYDKNENQLGYIPSGDVRLASHMDRGGEVAATIRSKGKKGKYYGLVLEITKKDFDWKAVTPYKYTHPQTDKLHQAIAKL